MLEFKTIGLFLITALAEIVGCYLPWLWLRQQGSAWLLLPTSAQGLPTIDGVAVPLVNNINNTRALALPQAWVENKHRAKTGPHTASPAGSHASPSAA